MTSRLQHQPSRPGFCLCCLTAPALAAAGVWLTPRHAFAEARGTVELIKSEAAKAPITRHRLCGDVTVLDGSGDNIAVLTRADGRLLLDAGISVSQRQVSAAPAELGPQPMAHIINTHWHFEYADGNEWLSSLAPKIIAHENTRKHLSTMQRVEDWDSTLRPCLLRRCPPGYFQKNAPWCWRAAPSR